MNEPNGHSKYLMDVTLLGPLHFLHIHWVFAGPNVFNGPNEPIVDQWAHWVNGLIGPIGPNGQPMGPMGPLNGPNGPNGPNDHH